MGSRFGQVQGAGKHAVLQGQDRLDDPRDAGGGLGVTDVRLEGAEPQRGVGRALLTVGAEEGLGLDGVAEPGPGAVGLDAVDVGGGETGVGQGGADEAGLGAAVGGGEAVGGTVLVDRGTPDDGEHGVSVAPRVGETLDQQGSDPLGPAGAVRALVERLAAPVGRQPALTGELEKHPGRRHDARATGDGQVAFTVAQRLHRQVQGDEGRRAGGVDRERRTLKTQHVGDPPGRYARRVSGQQEPVAALRLLGRRVGRVVLLVGPDEHPRTAAAQ